MELAAEVANLPRQVQPGNSSVGGAGGAGKTWLNGVTYAGGGGGAAALLVLGGSGGAGGAAAQGAYVLR